jgi:thymidylate synthase ThyX
MRTSYLNLWNLSGDHSESSWGFASPRPRVQLVKAFPSPFSNVIATARTCYSSKGIIPDQLPLPDRHRELAQDLYLAGHHTTFQHAHFEFALENVSRQFIWSFLHSHPFYNSEQVSQRYVTVKPGQYVIPELSEQAARIYLQVAEIQMTAYQHLVEKLYPLVKKEYFGRYRFRGEATEKHRNNVRKKAMEIARYVLPVATFAYLYHTLSGLTLLRYARMCAHPDVPTEQREVVSQMVHALLDYDPEYRAVLEVPIPAEEMLETRLCQEVDEASCSRARRFILEYDETFQGGGTQSFASSSDETCPEALPEGNRTDAPVFSRLVGWSQQAEEILANAVREVLGQSRSDLCDSEAIQLALDPARNPLLGESLNLSTHSKLTRALFHPHYTFNKRISHTADSQNQRHRMTPGSRPVLATHYTGQPDVICPEILRLSSECMDLYQETMEKTWMGINQLFDLGVIPEYALYLLPNALTLRFTESADLLNLRHKHAMRLCYNAQEEIWHASLEEALQIRAIHPQIGRYLLPPCGHRSSAGTKPYCPEGERYCGIPVWKLDVKEMRRLI